MNSPAQTSSRLELRNPVGKVKAAKLCPIMATPFIAGEGGLIEQRLHIELDPVAGRLVSQTWAKVMQVFVPVQACDALLNASDDTAGITEIIRRKIMEGETLFALENEGELTKRMDINPRPVSGAKRVSSIARIAHNAAVNHLRKRRYIYADLLDAADNSLTPAIIHETVLDRFGGALDPDEHINGNVALGFSADQLPISGSAPVTGVSFDGSMSANIDGAARFKTTAELVSVGNGADGTPAVRFARKSNATNTQPDINADLTNAFVDLSGMSAGGVSLIDFYNAQKADQLVRRMREVAEANPDDGEDAVLRWVFGLSVDSAKNPWVLYENRFPLMEAGQAATDGAGIIDEVMITKQTNVINWAVPVPKTELGGIVITFLQVTPDEVIDEQPHPILSDSWGAINHASSMMRLEPEAVAYRDLFSDITTVADETDTKFYTGANALKKTYIDYGFNRQVDPDTVDAKTVVWNYAIPAGVTPENILYPETFSQYPFLDQNAEVVTYNLQSVARISTPIFFGPTPVEKVAIVDDAEILG